MKSAELKALERIFAAEIEGRPLLQSNAAIYKRLADAGFVKPVKEVFYGTGNSAIDRLPMVVSGWALTNMGRIIYCENCR